MPSLNAGLLIAGVITAFVGAFGLFIATLSTDAPAEMQISPRTEVVTAGETVTVDIMIESRVPVNVFAGELRFNSSVLTVASIDYNTSIADLWAELPWYSNGEGTLNFGGGTTRQGGFTGEGPLITVTFTALKAGNGNLTITMPRILRHDGTGSDVELREVVERIVRVEDPMPAQNAITQERNIEKTLIVTPREASTDLNGDGRQTIADISIFMLNMTGNDSRYDFNADSKVDTKDLAILLSK